MTVGHLACLRRDHAAGMTLSDFDLTTRVSDFPSTKGHSWPDVISQ